MINFKFLNNNKPKTGERSERWVEINIHGYGFNIQTTRTSIQIMEEVEYIRRNFTLMSVNDHENRDNLLLLLRSRFLHAIDVVSHEELERNNGYIGGNHYTL